MARYEIRINDKLHTDASVSEHDQLEINFVNLRGSDGTVLTVTAHLPSSDDAERYIYREPQCIDVGDTVTITVSEPEIDGETFVTDPNNEVPESTMFCSFCGKGNQEVKNLVSGPQSLICDECVRFLNEIIENET